LTLSTPVWVFYRRMQFVKQRSLLAINQVSTVVVTVALAATGFGYWSLVLGTIAGNLIGGVAAMAASPYRLGLRLDRGTIREYFSFSWPLFLSNGAGFIVAQVSVFMGEWQLGLAGAGAIALASQISAYANRVDQIVTQALYPAICAVKDRRDLLRESFAKSNRLALMWGFPFGIAITLFAADLVHHVLGDKWEGAIGLIQAFGAIAAVNHIAFNYTAFFRAYGDTRPMAKIGAFNVGVFLLTAVPLLIVWGQDGYALGMGLTTLAALAGRAYYLGRLLGGFDMVSHSLRAIAPTVPAVLATLALRALDGPRTPAAALAELATYVAVTVLATVLLERALLREVVGYLRRRTEASAVTAA
jgi:O-antigen/teichoic acid export membrane protein